MSQSQQTEQTVYLRQNDETGTWLYTLPGANRLRYDLEVGGVNVPVMAGQRINKNSDTAKEQAHFEYHYVVLEGVDSDLDREEVISLGWSEEAVLNTQTGFLTVL